VITALDSSVLLDVLADNPVHAERSIRALQQASRQGRLIAGECAVAEIFPALGDAGRVHQFLADWQIDFVASDEESALLAGEMFLRFPKRGRERKKIVADFLIGAHATVHADRLLARDRGYLSDYFTNLTLIDPSTAG
jgi:predicted nucleic acid-binding protein